MIIVAILKHVAGKSADYGAALDYLKYEHDEVLKKPLLDANGNWVLRRDILLEGINCEPELFDGLFSFQRAFVRGFFCVPLTLIGIRRAFLEYNFQKKF